MELIEQYNVPLCLLHCVLNYPTPNKNANLGMIWDIKRNFPKHVPGYSDHTVPQGMEVILKSVLLGAAVIEKHFTFDKSLPGNDHYHAMDKDDLKLFWEKWKETESLLGSFKITSLPDEEPARKNARRSLVAAKHIPAGKVVEESDLTWKRPAHGVSPKFMKEIIGRRAVNGINEDEIIHWNMFN